MVKSIIGKKNSKFTKNTKKKFAGSTGVSSTIQIRAQRQGGRVLKTQKGSSFRPGTEINRQLKKNFNYALKSCSSGYVTLVQLRAMGSYLKRNIKKRMGGVMRRIFPYVPMTKKPSEVRMGKGKGSKVYNEIYPIRPGKIIFELRKIRASSAIFYLNLIASKLSVSTRVVKLKE